MTDRRSRRRAWGDGTAVLRSDGRWMAQVFVTEGGTGRKVRRTVYGRTEREVDRERQRLLDEEARGIPQTPANLTLAGYLQEWLEQIVAPRVRPNTLAGYKFHVDRYLAPDLGHRKLGQLTARDVRLYLDQLRQRGTGPRTIQYVHSTLRAALEDAMREEIVSKNVAKLVRVAHPPRKERSPYDLDEVRILLRYAKTDTRLYAMLIVFALLGLRRSEALALTWEDIDLKDGFLRVRKGLHRVDGALRVMPTKTERSRRTVPLPDIAVRALRDLQAEQRTDRDQLGASWSDSGYVFTTPIGTPIDPANCSKAVQAACMNAGLRRVRLHDFRHGCVSVLLSLGVPPRTVMDIAGHSAMEMTMNVYGHVSLDDKRQAIDRLSTALDDLED